MSCCSDAGVGAAIFARHPGVRRDPLLLLLLFRSIAEKAFALSRESLFFVCATAPQERCERRSLPVEPAPYLMRGRSTWMCGVKKSNQKKGHPCKAFALSRESLFFVWPKKSNQKKGHPGGAPTLCVGSQSQREFSNGTSVCLSKTAHIVCAALRVLPAAIAAPQGPRSSNSNSNSNSNPLRQSLHAASISPALRAREAANNNGRGDMSGFHRAPAFRVPSPESRVPARARKARS